MHASTPSLLSVHDISKQRTDSRLFQGGRAAPRFTRVHETACCQQCLQTCVIKPIVCHRRAVRPTAAVNHLIHLQDTQHNPTPAELLSHTPAVPCRLVRLSRAKRVSLTPTSCRLTPPPHRCPRFHRWTRRCSPWPPSSSRNRLRCPRKCAAGDPPRDGGSTWFQRKHARRGINVVACLSRLAIDLFTKHSCLSALTR